MKVLPHSRLRHFECGELDKILQSWRCDATEKARRLVDLVTVSVLLDAGAGSNWKYVAAGQQWQASEGLAKASLDLFLDGFFSTDSAMPARVNSAALTRISDDMLARGLQVSRSNPLIGVPG